MRCGMAIRHNLGRVREKENDVIAHRIYTLEGLTYEDRAEASEHLPCAHATICDHLNLQSSGAARCRWLDDCMVEARILRSALGAAADRRFQCRRAERCRARDEELVMALARRPFLRQARRRGAEVCEQVQEQAADFLAGNASVQALIEDLAALGLSASIAAEEELQHNQISPFLPELYVRSSDAVSSERKLCMQVLTESDCIRSASVASTAGLGTRIGGGGLHCAAVHA